MSSQDGGFVEAYVGFLQYVERIYESAKSPGEGHVGEAREPRESHAWADKLKRVDLPTFSLQKYLLSYAGHIVEFRGEAPHRRDHQREENKGIPSHASG